MSEPPIPATVNALSLKFSLTTPAYAYPNTEERPGIFISWTPSIPGFLQWTTDIRLGNFLSLFHENAFLVKSRARSSFGFKINFGSIELHDNIVKTKVLALQSGVQTEVELITLAPLGIGQSIEFCFPIPETEWIDPDSRFLYFKPSGKTFGNVGSDADLIYEGKLQALFLRLHRNNYLQLYDKNGVAIAKTNPADDWSRLCRLALPYHPGAATYSCGSAGTGETNWEVGMRLGTSRYTIPLVYHSHLISQTAHNHNIIQIPHSHNLAGSTYDADAGEGSDGSGSAYAPVANTTESASVDISMSSELVNFSLEPAGGDNELIVQTLGVGVERMIFTGVKL